MKPRNVLLMTRTLGHGGTERQLTEIALSLDRALFTPHVCCVEGHGFRADELRKNGVAILELPMTSMLSRQCLSGILHLRRYLRQHQISLVHTFDTPMNVFGVPVAKLLGGSVVLSSQRCHENVIWPLYRRPTRIAHFLADGVVANCHAMQDHLLRDYSVPARKIHVCPNGLDTSVFRLEPGSKPACIPDATLVIGSVCVLRPEKGLTTLLEAFALIRHIRPGMKLIVVGSGPEREILETRSRELGMNGDCLFYPATDDVPFWLRAIDIFVLPSVSEALSNSLMEAMGCGCCAIASEVGGNPELVRHRETGLLFQSGSAADLARQIQFVVLDDALRSQLARAGSEWVSANFSQGASARKMEAIYLQQFNER